jgi:hypothetical protein
MNRSQQSLLGTPPGFPSAQLERPVHAEEEVALGCECADPVLQIESWARDQAQAQQQAN